MCAACRRPPLTNGIAIAITGTAAHRRMGDRNMPLVIAFPFEGQTP
jgi:hypothetical protein